MKRFVLTLLLCACVFNLKAASLQKNKVVTTTGFYQPTFLLEIASGVSMNHYELGMDFQDDENLGFAGLYLSHNDYDVLGVTDDAVMTAIGIRGWQFSSQEGDLVGIDLHLGINRTTVGDYARTGVEIAMSFYENISKNTSLIFGGAFRPEFLSLDWSTDTLSEIGFEFGVNYKLGQSTNLFSKYYHETLIDDDFNSARIDDGALLGVTYIF